MSVFSSRVAKGAAHLRGTAGADSSGACLGLPATPRADREFLPPSRLSPLALFASQDGRRRASAPLPRPHPLSRRPSGNVFSRWQRVQIIIQTATRPDARPITPTLG